MGLAVVVLVAAGVAALGLQDGTDDVITAASSGSAQSARPLAPGSAGEDISDLPLAPYSSTSPTAESPVPTANTPLPAPPATTATTAAPGTTSTTAPAMTMTTQAPATGEPTGTFVVTIVNQFEAPVQGRINSQPFEVAPGQTVGPFTVEAVPSGNDTLTMWRSDTPTCRLGDAGGLFQPGRQFRMTVVTAGGSGCGQTAGTLKAPDFRITAA